MKKIIHLEYLDFRPRFQFVRFGRDEDQVFDLILEKKKF